MPASGILLRKEIYSYKIYKWELDIVEMLILLSKICTIYLILFLKVYISKGLYLDLCKIS